MSIVDSVLFNDMLHLFEQRSNLNDYTSNYKVDVITPTDEVVASKIHSVDIVRDFAAGNYDNIALLVDVTIFEYMELIYPNRIDLKVRLTEVLVHGDSGKEVPNPVTQLFTAKIINPTNLAITNPGLFGESANAKDAELWHLDLQLIPEEIEIFRLTDIDGIIQDSSVRNVLATLGSNYGRTRIRLHEPTDRETINQLLIPEGIPIIGFPAWLQKFGGGVYNYNINNYLLRGLHHIYPLYDTSNISTRKVVTLINIPKEDLVGIEATWLYEDEQITIIGNGEVSYLDESETQDFNVGNALIFKDTNHMGDGVEHNNGTTAVTDVGYHLEGEDKDTKNNIVVIEPTTNNLQYELSRLSGNRGVVAQVEWNNANPSLIEPNMEVEMFYQDGKLIKSIRGVILGLQSNSKLISGGGNPRFQTNSTLTLFLDRYDK